MSLVQGTMPCAAELTWSGQEGVEGEYQCAINRMAGSTLGAFRSAPQGILATESGLTPARALLDHRKARFAQRLHARPRDGGGPEEILDREGATITGRLRAAAGTRHGEKVEPQAWGEGKSLPGECCVGQEGPAVETAQNWQVRGAIGSRLDSGKVGTACAWQTREDWTGKRFHLGDNKEVFDAETFAIYQALRVLDSWQETGKRYAILSDSQSASRRIMTD